MLREDVPSPECYTGETVFIDGVSVTEVCGIPLCDVYLKSGLVTGYVKLGVVDRLPIHTQGISVLLGNDLAGEKMRPCPVVSPYPTSENNTEDLEKKHPSLFPACAVTRSMSKELSTIDGAPGPDMLGALSDNEVFSLRDFFKGSMVQQFKVTEGILSDRESPITRSKLIEEQRQDNGLRRYFENLVSESELGEYPNCFYLKSGVLMRQYRPLYTPSSDTWRTIHQVVLPISLRNHILAIAHDNIAGHLGVTKCYRKVFEHFYWPKMRRDIGNYCRTCHICQVKGKPGASVPPSPLIPIPVITEPFEKIVIDCVGPLPKTKRGNQYLLTIIDVASRYPEAIPLRRITTKNVVKALIKFFTQVGLPTMVQSDQGSNFTSGLFERVMKSLGIKQYKSTAYHPQSQGVVERFHLTLKTMIRAYCLETGSEWDDGIDLLLFSVRDSVQESLGYSPFQLVYGHEVRGPLKVLKECWLSEEESVPAASYVETFKHRLKSALSFAHTYLGKAQSKMKMHYDEINKAELREFKEANLVLALLPMPNQPLKSRYSGPFKVLKRVSEVNYVLATPLRRKKKRSIHVNLLKKYCLRDRQCVTEEYVKDVAVVVPCGVDYMSNSIGDADGKPVVPVI